jgi:uncharacterized membrane protein YkvA (DUF1232 family)
MMFAANPYFSRARDKARRVLSEPGRLQSLLQAASEKASTYRGRIGAVRNDLAVMLRLARAWVAGGYRAIPWRTMVGVVAALVYFVNPVDLVPDWIQGAGFIDDAAVISLVARAIREDLNRFLDWERSGRYGRIPEPIVE